jgi:hypothetical protein
MSNLIKALQIFLKYEDNPYPTNCDHDVLFVSIDPAIVSPEDINTLAELGFDVSDCGFQSFHYGSN